MSRDPKNMAVIGDIQTDNATTTPAEMQAGVDGGAATLDIFRFFEKPESGDDLAVFGLTKTNAERRRRSTRLI